MSVETNKETALQQATTWFARLDSGEVSDEAKAQFFAWLDTHEINQQAYIEIEQLWGKLEIVERLPVDEMLQKSNWFGVIVGGWRQIGALLSVLAISTIAALYLNKPADVLEQLYVTAVGEQLDFRLEDGSLLQLNTDTAVSVRMDESRRLLELRRGEAYFDIAPDSERPLSVRTTSGMVRVLGTQFNIRQTPGGSIVSVIEGRVAIAPRNGTQQPDFEAQLTLLANQQARLTENQPMDEVASIDGDIVIAWRQGQLIYEGNTLAEVIDDLNRYFPGKIALDDSSLGEKEIVGVINLENKTKTLKMLEATFDVEVVVVTGDLTLIKQR